MRETKHETKAARWWGIAFVGYGVLSLSSMAGMSIGLGIFGAATLWFAIANWRQGAKESLAEAFRTPFSWISLALFLASLLSLLAAMAFPVEGSTHGPELSSLKKYHYYFFPPLFAAAILAKGEIEKHPFWKTWGIWGAILGAMAIVQFFGRYLFPDSWLTSSFFRQAGATGYFHGQGLMFFHLSFASCMCFVASTAWARVIFPRLGDTLKLKFAWAACAVLSTAGVFYSYSRIAFVAIAIVLVLLCLLRKPVWGLISAASLVGLFTVVWQWSGSLQTRWYNTLGSNFDRLAMWKSSWAMFLDRPLTGIGFSRTGELSPYYVNYVLKDVNKGFTSHAHNNFLDMLAATGSIGFVVFLAWWVFLMGAAILAFKRAPLSERWLPAAVLAGFVSFHINGLTQVNYWDGKSEHTLMLFSGVAIALWIREKRRAATHVHVCGTWWREASP